MSGLVVRELTSALRDDFLWFFDHVAFADNPEWADCYCTMYYGQSDSAAENRRLASNLIVEEKVHGFLAYDNGKPVAWCNAGPRTSYPAVSRLKGPASDAERVGSIVCFVVASSHRNQRIASRLLEAACKEFSKEGLEFAEAYPRKKSKSAADNFPGPLSMYLKAGFSTYRDADSYLVVRKRLEASG